MVRDSFRLEIGTNTETYLLPKQLIIHSETVKSTDIFPQLQVALSELLDILAGFGQDSSFTLKREENNYFKIWKMMPLFLLRLFFFLLCPFGNTNWFLIRHPKNNFYWLPECQPGQCIRHRSSPVLSWYNQCYSLGWPLTAEQSSC